MEGAKSRISPFSPFLHPPPCARGPGASAPTAGQGLWVLVFAGACQGTAWAGLCLIHHHHRFRSSWRSVGPSGSALPAALSSAVPTSPCTGPTLHPRAHPPSPSVAPGFHASTNPEPGACGPRPMPHERASKPPHPSAPRAERRAANADRPESWRQSATPWDALKSPWRNRSGGRGGGTAHERTRAPATTRLVRSIQRVPPEPLGPSPSHQRPRPLEGAPVVLPQDTVGYAAGRRAREATPSRGWPATGRRQS